MFSTTKSSYLMAYNGDIIMIFTWNIIQLVGGFRYNNILYIHIYICIHIYIYYMYIYIHVYIYIPLDNNGPPADLPIWSDPVGPWPTDPAVHQRPGSSSAPGKKPCVGKGWYRIEPSKMWISS